MHARGVYQVPLPVIAWLVILNVTEGGVKDLVKDLLYLSFQIGAKRRSINASAANF